MSYQPTKPDYIIALDYVGDDLTYQGVAAAGTAKAAASWQVKRFTYSGSDLTDIQYADGDTDLNNIWDNRATLDYS